MAYFRCWLVWSFFFNTTANSTLSVCPLTGKLQLSEQVCLHGVSVPLLAQLSVKHTQRSSSRGSQAKEKSFRKPLLHFWLQEKKIKDCFCRRTYHISTFLLHFLQKVASFCTCALQIKSFSFQSFTWQPPLLLTPCLLTPCSVRYLHQWHPFVLPLPFLLSPLSSSSITVSVTIYSFNALFQVDAGGWGVLRQ